MATNQVGESRDVEALVHGERQVLEPPARRLGRAGSAVSRHLPRGERLLSEDRS